MAKLTYIELNSLLFSSICFDMTRKKLKGLNNLAQWSHHGYKLVLKQRNSNKEIVGPSTFTMSLLMNLQLPPTNTATSPPESPKCKHPRLSKALSSTPSGFQMQWAHIAPQSTGTDGHLLCTLTHPASPIPPKTFSGHCIFPPEALIFYIDNNTSIHSSLLLISTD